MERKFYKSVLCVAMTAFAITGGVKVYEHLNSPSSCDIILANVEALAQKEGGNNGYHVHHFTYFDPVTHIKTDKCYATSYSGPNGSCTLPHNHGAQNCCSAPC